jgi:chromosome segregation ATPase
VGKTTDALRAENDALRAKAAAVADALAKVEAKFAAELEVRSLEVRMAQAQQQRAEAVAKEAAAHITRLEGALEQAGKRDEDVKAKFESIHQSFTQYTEKTKLMEARAKESSKQISLLEQTKALLERAKAGTEAALLQALADKQRLEADLAASTQQTAKALGLCKVLQGERKMLLEKLNGKGEGVGEGGGEGKGGEGAEAAASPPAAEAAPAPE